MILRQLRQLTVQMLAFVTLLAPVFLSAQSSRTAKLLKKADAYFVNHKYAEAEDIYQQVIADEPTNRHVAQRLAKIRQNYRDYEQALRWYQAAAKIDPNSNDTLYLFIGDMYKRLNKYAEARVAYNEFMKRHREMNDAYYKRAEVEILGCDYAERAKRRKHLYEVKEMPTLNTKAGGYAPSILDQRQASKFLVISSFRKLPGKRNKKYEYTGEQSFSDLYRAEIINDTSFGRVEPMPAPINTKFNDGSATFSIDGMTMYFATANGTSSGLGSVIYEARYNPLKKAWNKPVPVKGIGGYREAVVDTRGKTARVPCFDSQPELARDGRTMFFVSDREGGQGGMDIWYAKKQGSGWTPPVNMGSTINTPFNEASPAIDSAGHILFFASNGHLGFGGYDLFEVEGDLEEFTWGLPMNLGADLNTTADELEPYLLHSDSIFYYTTDRNGGAGGYDLYIAYKQDTLQRVPEVIVPEVPRKKPAQVSVQGLIRDKDSKQPIPFATAILYRITDENTIVPLDTFKTDQSARYNFPLELNAQYKVLGNAPEYFANEVEVSTVGIEKDTELERNVDIQLERIIIGNEIVLQNVYYDFDEYFIRTDAVIELNRLVKILVQNPNITIQLGSHTDSNGGDEYNRSLSDNRAKSCVRYLVESGISPSRISWNGYGESLPLVYPELTDEDEQANRRTEFRVMSIDYAQRPR